MARGLNRKTIGAGVSILSRGNPRPLYSRADRPFGSLTFHVGDRTMRRTLQLGSLALVLALAVPAAHGQSRTTAGKNNAPPAQAVSFDDVLRLVRQGQDAPAILAACDTVFTLGPAQREQLRRAGAAP